MRSVEGLPSRHEARYLWGCVKIINLNKREGELDVYNQNHFCSIPEHTWRPLHFLVTLFSYKPRLRMNQCRYTDHWRHRHWSSLKALKNWHWWHWDTDTDFTGYTDPLKPGGKPIRWARSPTGSTEKRTIIHVHMHRFKAIFQCVGWLSLSIWGWSVKSVSVFQCTHRHWYVPNLGAVGIMMGSMFYHHSSWRKALFLFLIIVFVGFQFHGVIRSSSSIINLSKDIVSIWYNYTLEHTRTPQEFYNSAWGLCPFNGKLLGRRRHNTSYSRGNTLWTLAGLRAFHQLMHREFPCERRENSRRADAQDCRIIFTVFGGGLNYRKWVNNFRFHLIKTGEIIRTLLIGLTADDCDKFANCWIDSSEYLLKEENLIPRGRAVCPKIFLEPMR